MRIVLLTAALLISVSSFAQAPSPPFIPKADVQPTPSHAGNEYAHTVEATRVGFPKGVKSWEVPKAYPTRTFADLNGFTPKPITLDKWGGRLDISAPATDFFYVKKIDGRWWAIDPEGHAYLHQAVNDIGINPAPDIKAAVIANFGSPAGWMSKTHAMLLENGFHGAGGFSNPDLVTKSSLQSTHPLAYVVVLDVMRSYGASRNGLHEVPGHAGYLGDCIFVFDPAFPAFADNYVKSKLETYAKDPALFGYFSDNEMPIAHDNLDKYLALPHQEAGYIAVKKWMDDHKAATPTDSLRTEFLAFEIDRYASIVSAAIRKYDPHHMYLGSRFNAQALLLPEAFAAMGKYADVISANYYYIRNAPESWNAWTPDPAQMDTWEQAAHKPIMITEFYAKGNDTGLSNMSGGGWLVPTQAARAAYYQNFTLALLQSKDVVGWNWFRYQDAEPATSKVGKDTVNMGIMSVTYKPYTVLLDAMKQINTNSYALADYFDHRKQ